MDALPHLPVSAVSLARRAATTVVAALVATVVVVGGPVAATADSAASIAFTTPSSDGAVFSSSPVTLSGTADAGTGVVVAVDLTVRGIDNPTAVTTTQTPSAPGSTVAWSWSPPLAYNGRYTLSAVATTESSAGGSQSQNAASVTLVVDVPPQPPSGVTSGLDPSTGAPWISWAANPEPDIANYLILRAGPGAQAPFAPIALVGAASADFTDTGLKPSATGLYRYAVVAIRPSGAGRGTDPSMPSAATAIAFAGSPDAALAPTWTPPSARRAPRLKVPGLRVPPRVAPTPNKPGAIAAPATVSPSTAAPAATTVPTTAAPSAVAPAAAAVTAPATGRNTRRTAYEVLDALLIVSVLTMLTAVARERRGATGPLEPLVPEAVLDDLAVGGSITIGEALALRRLPDVPAPPPRPAKLRPPTRADAARQRREASTRGAVAVAERRPLRSPWRP